LLLNSTSLYQATITSDVTKSPSSLSTHWLLLWQPPLPLPHARVARRSAGSPRHPAALRPAAAEGARWRRCCERPPRLPSAPGRCSRPASAASLLTFCSPPALLPCPGDGPARQQPAERGHGPGTGEGRSRGSLGRPHLSPVARGRCSSWGPLLLRGCWLSAACSSQAGAEQRPPPVPSGSDGGRGHAAGESGEAGDRTAPLPCAGSRALGLRWGCCCPSRRARPSPWLCGRRELSPCPLAPKPSLSRALGSGGTALRGSASARLALLLHGSLLSFPRQQAGPAGGGGGCPGHLPGEGPGLLQRCPGHRALVPGGLSLAGPWQPSAARTERCPSPSR